MHETTLRIAILAEEPLGYGSGKHYFPTILDGYRWETTRGAYRFTAEYVYDEDVRRGWLTRRNFDALVVPGGGVGDGEAVTKALNFLGSVQRFKRVIDDFIRDGGGYVGICGGAALMTGLDTAAGKPRSLLERLYDSSSIGSSCVQCYYKHLSLPLLTLLQGKYPERVGATTYVFSFAPGETRDGKLIHTGGAPVDFEVNPSHPLFAGYSGDTLRMRWWGGPGLIVPERPDREVSVVASYPRRDFSHDPSTQVAAWRYTGGAKGLLRAARDAVQMIVKEGLELSDIVSYTYYLARDWQKTDTPIDLDCGGRPAVTAEVYPNANGGRIVLCAPHPEYMIWWGGKIEEVEPSDGVCLGRGLHRWRDIKPLSDTLQDELTYTWWFVRRMAAWAAKVPDDAMPPIAKGEITAPVRDIIDANIYWDGTLVDQMRNI